VLNLDELINFLNHITFARTRCVVLLYVLVALAAFKQEMQIPKLSKD